MDDKKSPERRDQSGAKDKPRDRAADVRTEIAKRRAEHATGKHLKR
jgi:hypothetical protein